MTTLTMKGELKNMIALTSMMLVLGSLSLPAAQAEQASAREKPRITVTEIEALRGDSVQVTSLNDRGVIVGAMYFADIDRAVPISWNPRDGVEKVVGDLPGAESGIATDINNRGTIVGNIVYNMVPRGFMWSEADGFVDLGSFLPNAINDRGQIAGTCVEELSQNFQFWPCFWEDGSITELGDGGRRAVAGGEGRLPVPRGGRPPRRLRRRLAQQGRRRPAKNGGRAPDPRPRRADRGRRRPPDGGLLLAASAANPGAGRMSGSNGASAEEPIRLGGMALRNGLLVHGPTHWAAAVRTDAPIRWNQGTRSTVTTVQRLPLKQLRPETGRSRSRMLGNSVSPFATLGPCLTATRSPPRCGT